MSNSLGLPGGVGTLGFDSYIIAIKFIETNCLSLCFLLVPFRGKTQLKLHPSWYLLGVQLKFPDKHLCPLYMGAPPG